LSERLSDFFDRTSPRERVLLALGAVVVAVGVGGPLLWLPLQRDLAQSELDLAKARAQLATARRDADEIAGLQRSARTPRTADVRAAVERIVGAQGLRPALTALDLQGDRARLTFAAVPFDALVPLLDAAAAEEQLFPVEALLAARVEPGSVRAELTLARSAATP
jgi:general secretion pathway protein M